jgi:2-polyprenyl-6-methoxyphenol hydroxylase-like FAD-dependent oxidoreductase
VPVGEAFRARFKNPYAVSHRADLHGAIHEAVKQHPLIRFHTSAQVESIDTGGRTGVTAVTRDGRRFRPTPSSAATA